MNVAGAVRVRGGGEEREGLVHRALDVLDVVGTAPELVQEARVLADVVHVDRLVVGVGHRAEQERVGGNVGVGRLHPVGVGALNVDHAPVDGLEVAEAVDVGGRRAAEGDLAQAGPGADAAVAVHEHVRPVERTLGRLGRVEGAVVAGEEVVERLGRH